MTIEECHQEIKKLADEVNTSDSYAQSAIAFGLCAIAYGIRDLAIAVEQGLADRESRG